MVRIAALAAAASVLAACGSSKTSDTQRAVEQVNAGTAPFFLQEFVVKSGPIRSCHISPRPEREGEMLLAVVGESNDWLQGTIDLDAPLAGHDITTGGNLDPQTLAMLRSEGETCSVSAEDGTVSLD
jgi:hypothetical protein